MCTRSPALCSPDQIKCVSVYLHIHVAPTLPSSLTVRLSACLPVCPSVCLPACPSVCVHACVSAFLSAYLADCQVPKLASAADYFFRVGAQGKRFRPAVRNALRRDEINGLR